MSPTVRSGLTTTRSSLPGIGETYLLLEGSMADSQLKSIYDRVHERRKSRDRMEAKLNGAEESMMRMQVV